MASQTTSDLHALEIIMLEYSDTVGDHHWIAADIIRRYRENQGVTPAPGDLEESIVESALLGILLAAAEANERGAEHYVHPLNIASLLIVCSDRGILPNTRKILRNLNKRLDSPGVQLISNIFENSYEALQRHGALKNAR